MLARVLVCMLFLNISQAQTIECTGELASPSCRSFAELLRAHDKGVLSDMGPGVVFLACFRKTSDVFFTVSFEKQAALTYVEDANHHFRTAPSYLSYERYSDGVSQDAQIYSGTWTHYFFTGSRPYFSADKDAQDKERGASISDSEIDLAYSFVNLSGDKTAYSVQIRRSTKRFVETFNFEKNQVNQTGYCKEF